MFRSHILRAVRVYKNVLGRILLVRPWILRGLRDIMWPPRGVKGLVIAAQPRSLGLIRTDVMLESLTTSAAAVGDYSCFKQVEVNTIAAGFGWLGPVSAMMHRCVCPSSLLASITLISTRQGCVLNLLCSTLCCPAVRGTGHLYLSLPFNPLPPSDAVQKQKEIF